MSMDADAAAVSKKAKLLSCLKAIFLPTGYSKYPCRNFKMAAAVLCCVYIFSVICTVCALRGFVARVCDDAETLLNETDNFYMKDFRLYYEGEGYTSSLNSLGLTVVIDPNIDPPTSAEEPTLWFGPKNAAVLTDMFTYSIRYSELAQDPSDLDFDKDFVIAELGYGRTLVLNVLCSSSIFAATVLAAVLLIVVILVSLVILGLSKCFDADLVFEQRLFVAISSFVYPFLLSGIICIVPGGLDLFISYASVMLRFFIAIVLFYALAAILSFKKSIRLDEKGV